MSEFMCTEMVLFSKAFWYGAVLTMIYDCLRILRNVFPHSDRMTACEDFVFWIGTSFFLFSHFFEDNFGILRGYLFLGAGLGGMSWRISISRLFVPAVGKLIKTFANQVKRLKLWKRRCNIFLYHQWNKKKRSKKSKKEIRCQKKNVEKDEIGKSNMKEQKTKKKKRNRHRLHRCFDGPNTLGVLVSMLIVCVLAVVLYVEGNGLKSANKTKEDEILRLEEELVKEKERTDDIKEMENHVMSDEEIEKIAREKIGLIKENEIVFKEDE